MMGQFAALQARVAQLEVEHSLVPPDGPVAPSGRLREAYAAVRRERDELAVQLMQIEAYQPGITEKAWVAEVDGSPKRW
jgi:hypothetical protein